jgi:IS1 family transposase
VQKQKSDIDYIDKIDDKYDLYSEIIDEKIIDNPTKEQIQEAMKPIEQNHLANLKNTFLSYTSFYRITAYVLLITGFFYLNNNDMLQIIPYLLGFIVVPLLALAS